MYFTEEQGDNHTVVSLNFLFILYKFWHNYHFSYTNTSLKN